MAGSRGHEVYVFETVEDVAARTQKVRVTSRKRRQHACRGSVVRLRPCALRTCCSIIVIQPGACSLAIEWRCPMPDRNVAGFVRCRSWSRRVSVVPERPG